MVENKKKKKRGIGMNGNLTSIYDRTPEERSAMGRKGALTPSPKKSIAAKIRWLVQKGLTDENAQHLSEVLASPELSALDTRLYLERIKKRVTDAREMNVLAKNFMDWHRTHHGTRIKQENVNINIDIDAEIKDMDDYIDSVK